jgi:hypothetical protein
MTCAVVVGVKVPGYGLWNANSAGGVQREAYYRGKCGNSHYPLNHQTKTHVQLSHASLES